MKEQSMNKPKYFRGRHSVLAGAAAATALNLLLALPALAAEPVTDLKAQSVARQILEDYKQERKENVPRWGTLAYDEGGGPKADCPVSKNGNSNPVSFKDCNLEYFKLREERWEDVLQSWAVLTPDQKKTLSPQINAIFDGMKEVKATSMGSQAVKKGYEGNGGLAGLLGALGINADDDTAKTVTAMLEGSFLADKSEAMMRLLKFNGSADLPQIKSEIEGFTALFKGSDGKGFDTTRLLDSMQLNKQEADTEKGRLAATTYMATNSRSRADAVKDITAKIQALGSSKADASLVSAQLAHYEFQLAALDALGREELIKSGMQQQGERAEERLKATAFQAARTEQNLKRTSK
jgi:hypothetical protein